ncbi:pyridoxine/pyridoxamine 5'-phosphate oxidase 2-like isoform X2 [Zingiber officinale]|uniref:pyridoxine/pyridoxamine 5'-phosphate oxidase 2-like isoform X2 n=1 Tax=Zingiber officinale TaxID=94328 RepID=UPI001C4DCCB4|nr:pyridoxine/pyridoxamine 5'-phosphate oxidase 2-like isoform X2 [Zingiber officinale]
MASWKPLLLKSLDSNAHLKHSAFFQLATIGSNGRPSNRTVVFRGFQEDTDMIQINTDCRSVKVCWYFTESWEQFRLKGTIDIIDATNSDALKLQKREKAWFASSLKSRLQYLAPTPSLPAIAIHDPGEEIQLDPSEGPVDAFCLLIFDPDQVDYLNLRSNERLIFTSKPNGPSCKLWMSQKINP